MLKLFFKKTLKCFPDSEIIKTGFKENKREIGGMMGSMIRSQFSHGRLFPECQDTRCSWENFRKLRPAGGDSTCRLALSCLLSTKT